jgi:uncharacterized protein YodC (DUF2158 family)
MSNDNEDGFWEIPNNCDITTFDFSWRPDPYDPPFIHQFGTQHQKTGGPKFIVKGATQVKYQDCQRVVVLELQNSRAWRKKLNIEFDYSWHPDETDPPFIYQFPDQWNSSGGPRYVVRGATQVKLMNYPVAKALPIMINWEIPSNINRDEFDFSWYPDENEDSYIYQFGTQWQKTGGPRYIVTGATRVKYIDIIKAQALPTRKNWTILYDIDESSFDWSWHPDSTEREYNYVFGNNLRSAEECPTVIYKVDEATQTKYCYDQVANINRTSIDLFFVSNGETGEANRYQHLCNVSKRMVKWIRGVKGRENALRKAAELSLTEWFFVFPGKLLADESFDFDWQPDIFIERKHYIFYATNPVNGLQYGHMAAVAYNKTLVLETIDYGLDFTMSKQHDIVPVNSGLAQFNSDSIMTWRTAFREAIKLKLAADQGDDESASRLQIWTTVGTGKNSEYSILGAKHGIEYYEEVNGDLNKLQLSFEWDWLDKKFNQLINNT